LATCEDCNTLPYREPKAGAISILLEIRDKSIRFMHEMRNAETGEIAAICEFTGVHLDRQARKSVPFADSIRRTAAKRLALPEPTGGEIPAPGRAAG